MTSFVQRHLRALAHQKSELQRMTRENEIVMKTTLSRATILLDILMRYRKKEEPMDTRSLQTYQLAAQ